MILWFAGMSFVIVWNVFRDPALDYRLVVLGALLPDLVDRRYLVMHSVVTSAVLLAVVMAVTHRRRRLRRRLLALPIGSFLHLVLDGAWTDPVTFWWPSGGPAPLPGRVPVAGRPVALVVAQELIGLAALAWCWRTFRLGEPSRNAAFARTGRLGRDGV